MRTSRWRSTLLDPSPSLVTYAFLGAYFFGIQLAWQGYLRADLRPKTYTMPSAVTTGVRAALVNSASEFRFVTPVSGLWAVMPPASKIRTSSAEDHASG